MRAVHLVEYARPDGLRIVETDEPVRGDRILVDLRAVGVAFLDPLQSRAGYQVVRPLPALLGMEAAGIVRSAPEGLGLTPGQRVAVLADTGTWQRTVVVDSTMVFALRLLRLVRGGRRVSPELPHRALRFRRAARYRPGETVLVHGAAGGVGLAALQVASALGLDTIVMVSTAAIAEVAAHTGPRMSSASTTLRRAATC